MRAFGWLASAPAFLFFTGKSGVGKTSLACAAALALADAGRKVLLVSTDPASNLDEMLGVALADRPRPVPGAPGLAALNIDPQAAADAYRQRVLSQMPAAAAEEERAKVREQLAGACTTEIAAFVRTWRRRWKAACPDWTSAGSTRARRRSATSTR